MKHPSPKLLLELKKAALLATEKAGPILSKNFRKKIKIKEKDELGWVTEVDLKAEELIIKTLKKHGPKDFSFLAEESGVSANSSSPQYSQGRWIIDPLDGTNNYAKGFPFFCISIAAEIEDCLSVGIVYHPILDELFSATLSGGAFLNKKKIYVSQTKNIEKSLLTTGFAYFKRGVESPEMQSFAEVSKKAFAIRRPGSAALDLAYTAAGFFDGYWEKGIAPWDVAAGVLLVKEAGGLVTDFNLNPYTLNKNELIAAPKSIHTQIQPLVSPFFQTKN